MSDTDLHTLAIPFENKQSAALAASIVRSIVRNKEIRDAFGAVLKGNGDSHENRETLAEAAIELWRDDPMSRDSKVPGVDGVAVAKLAMHAVLIMWFGHLPNSPTGILPKHPKYMARDQAERN